MRIIESIPQWSPYPHGTNAVACTETMQSIDHAASFFMDIAPGDAPPMDPRVRFGEPLPIDSKSFTTVRLVKAIEPHEDPAAFRRAMDALCSANYTPRDGVPSIETCAPNAREWLESDGIPEAIGDTDHEDTKPAAPRNSTPIIEGAPEDRERYPGKSLAW